MSLIFNDLESISDLVTAVNFHELETIRRDLVQSWTPATATPVDLSSSFNLSIDNAFFGMSPITLAEASLDPLSAIHRLIDATELLNRLNHEKANYLREAFNRAERVQKCKKVDDYLRILISAEYFFEKHKDTNMISELSHALLTS